MFGASVLSIVNFSQSMKRHQAVRLVLSFSSGIGRGYREAATSDKTETRSAAQEERRATVRRGHGRVHCHHGGETVCPHQGKDHAAPRRTEGHGRNPHSLCDTILWRDAASAKISSLRCRFINKKRLNLHFSSCFLDLKTVWLFRRFLAWSGTSTKIASMSGGGGDFFVCWCRLPCREQTGVSLKSNTTVLQSKTISLNAWCLIEDET